MRSAQAARAAPPPSASPAPYHPYAAGLWEAGAVVNAIGSGPDSDELSDDVKRYSRAIADVMAMIRLLQLTSCPDCGAPLAPGGTCNAADCR